MRFTPQGGRALLAGRKTTHRIPIRGQQPCPYPTRQPLPFQFEQTVTDSYKQPIRNLATGEPRKQYAHDAVVIIDTVHEEPLTAIKNPPALKAEGFTTLEDFALYWIATHDSDTLMRREAAAGRLTEPVEQWEQRHGHRNVWVMALRIEYPDRDEFLAPGAGYSTSLLPGAPDSLPVVRRDTLERFAEDNERRFRAARGDEHARREVQRLARTVREESIASLNRGVDVSDELARIGHELDSMRRKREEHAQEGREAA